ncbi:MAG: NAD(P)H-hydrate dehydratase [Candidatus Aenigmarchaeota archaeon]|nr:NAD(P)H-hydrate dehydratase [Candidatus Aenigmarchaeota archaeon]
MRYVSKTILKQVYKKREPWVHKGQFGRLAVIAGSKIHTGSPIFVGMSAYRAGCDLVYMTGPQRAMDVAANYSPSLITKPLEGDYLEEKHVDKVLSFIENSKATAVVIGPGLWRIDKTRKAINMIVERIDLPMVIDADAIRSVTAIKDKLKNKKLLIIPHANEFLELTGKQVSENIKDRINTARKEAYDLNCGKDNTCPLYPSITIALKGNVDVISNGKEIVLNDTGVPTLTKGGCGDTLTGIAGALLARKIGTFTAGCVATYINGKAGELASKKYGEGVLPTDLIEEIPNVIKGG